MWSAALTLGLVQGLAEFLPISSSGHLLLLRSFLGIAAPGASLEVVLHLGTLVAVVIRFRATLGRLLHGLVRGANEAWRLALLLAVASIPAAIAGLVGGVALETWLFRPAMLPLGFLLTSAALWSTPEPSKGRLPLDRLAPVTAVWIGSAQALALIPGLSRSGATIVASRWAGVEPQAAAEFSFLLLIPVTLGAVVIDHAAIATLGWPLLFGALTATVTGLFALQWAMTAIRSRNAWRGFGLYTLVMAFLAWRE